MSDSSENSKTPVLKNYLNEIQLKYSFLNFKKIEPDDADNDENFHMLNGQNFDLIQQKKPNELDLNINGLKLETQELYIDDMSGLSTRSNEFFTHQIELIPNTTLPILDDSILACLDDFRPNNNERKQSSDFSAIEDSDVANFKQTEELSHLKFALKFVKNTFSHEEIKTGIFGDKNNNSKSRTQTPFSVDKVELVKSSLAERFSLANDQIDKVWSRLRPKLNKKLADMRRTQRVKLN